MDNNPTDNTPLQDQPNDALAPAAPPAPAPEPPAPEPPAAEPPFPEQPAQPTPEQPLPPQPAAQLPVPPAPGQATTKSDEAQKKKLILIGSISAGAIVLIAIIAVVLINFVGGAKKILTCTEHQESYGIVGDLKYTFKINDGSIAEFSLTSTIDLAKSELGSDQEEIDKWIQSRIETDEKSCSSGCSFSHSYIKGQSLEETLTYDETTTKTMIGTDLSKYTADEIYDELKNSTKLTGFECK